MPEGKEGFFYATRPLTPLDETNLTRRGDCLTFLRRNWVESGASG
jgi:hypothetical protein